jgi:hypothetical protein
MTQVCRPEATTAIVCVALLPLLAVLCVAVADANPTGGSWRVVLSAGALTFATGLGSAIAGVRRGSRASRAAAAACLAVLAIPVVGAVVGCALLLVSGRPRFG